MWHCGWRRVIFDTVCRAALPLSSVAGRSPCRSVSVWSYRHNTGIKVLPVLSTYIPVLMLFFQVNSSNFEVENDINRAQKSWTLSGYKSLHRLNIVFLYMFAGIKRFCYIGRYSQALLILVIILSIRHPLLSLR